MSEVLRACSRYLAIVAAGAVCLGLGCLFAQPRPLQYFESSDCLAVASGLAASLTIFLVGTMVARKLK
jgi:hypothetical protein